MPFGPYADFESCVEDNQEKDSPEGYCAYLHYLITGEWPGIRGEKAMKRLSLEAVRRFCPSCAEKMEARGIKALKLATKDISYIIDAWDEWAGSYTECVNMLSDKPGIDDPEALCAWLHYQAEGEWPGEKSAHISTKANEELYPEIEKRLNELLGEGYLRALFVDTAIFLVYSESDDVVEMLYEVPWTIVDGEITLGEPREVEVAYVAKAILRDTAAGLVAPIVYKNEEKRTAYGPVLVPGEPDHDGEVVSAERIESVAHEFLRDYGNIDVDHSLNNVGRPVESYIAPVDFAVGKTAIPKGTWMLGVYVEDDQAWAAVKKGKLKGFSVMGVPRSELVEAQKSATGARKILLSDLGEDWIITHVSLVEDPSVIKAKFLAVKEREKPSLKERLWGAKEGRRFSSVTLEQMQKAYDALGILIKAAEQEAKKAKEEDEMTPEEVTEIAVKAMEEVLGKERETLAWLLAEQFEALKSQMVTPPAEPPEGETGEGSGDGDTEAAAKRVEELEGALKAVSERLDKMAPHTVASKAIQGQDQAAGPPAERDFGGPTR